jgi:hypothetical protein
MTTPNQEPELPVWQPSIDAEPVAADPAAATAEAASPTAVAAPAADGAIPTPHVPVKPRRLNSTAVLLVVAGLVAVGGVGFAIGHVSGGSSTGTTTGVTGDGNGQFGPNGSGAIRPDGSFVPGDFGGRDGVGGVGSSSLITGTVTAISADSMTIQLADGQTVTVALSSSTTWNSQTSTTSSSVTTGASVIVKTTTSASASASPGAAASGGTTRQATDVTVTSGN